MVTAGDAGTASAIRALTTRWCPLARRPFPQLELAAKKARDHAHDLGAVPRVVSVEPIFVVSDVPRAVAHYEQLGFSTSHHDEGYAFAHRNELTIHLVGAGVDPERVGRGSIYMHVDDADALADERRSAGIAFVEPRDFKYGKREGSRLDPDGNLIRFGSQLRPWRRGTGELAGSSGAFASIVPMISGDRALEIEKQFALLLDVQVDELRDYLAGNIGTSSTRRTGFRFVRGTHGGHYIRDREGTDIAPAGVSAR